MEILAGIGVIFGICFPILFIVLRSLPELWTVEVSPVELPPVEIGKEEPVLREIPTVEKPEKILDESAIFSEAPETVWSDESATNSRRPYEWEGNKTVVVGDVTIVVNMTTIYK
ncbi:MAG: hypothetical protein PHO46_11535 [Thermoguttaceae bacterium]|nr:hypothetical protein [Thermoguttaceae bacterium]